MADTEAPQPEQASIEMPNGVVLTGVGGDVEAISEQIEERHEQRTGKPAEASVSTDGSAEVATGEPPQLKAGRARKRIDQITAEREAEKRRADALEARLKALEDARTAPSAPQPKTESAAPAATVEYTRPEPQESDVGTKYSTYAAFIKDLAEWTAEQREVKLRADFDARLKQGIEADRASRTFADHVSTVFENGRKAYTDFDAALDSTKHIQIPFTVRDAILSLPNPEKVMYALAKDHATLQEVVKVGDNPGVLAAALAQLMPRAEAVAPPAPTPAAVRTSNAPAPPQPVGAGSRTAAPSLEELAKSGDYEGYKRLRNAQRAG